MSARDIRQDEPITNAVFASLKDYGMTVDVEAFHAALTAAGYAVVPREPTEAMVVAGEQEPLMSDAYRAMLAAGEATP